MYMLNQVPCFPTSTMEIMWGQILAIFHDHSLAVES